MVAVAVGDGLVVGSGVLGVGEIGRELLVGAGCVPRVESEFSGMDCVGSEIG
ncbi:MAG: hypothetical protein KAS38_10120 [Anaerolineales bacterium]|nr:hypothetical protein [Anaerolineales bacterium]